MSSHRYQHSQTEQGPKTTATINATTTINQMITPCSVSHDSASGTNSNQFAFICCFLISTVLCLGGPPRHAMWLPAGDSDIWQQTMELAFNILNSTNLAEDLGQSGAALRLLQQLSAVPSLTLALPVSRPQDFERSVGRKRGW